MKDNWSAGDLNGNFGNQYELLMFITKGRHKIRGTRWSNIWQFPKIPAKKLRVATEKPAALLQRAIFASSDESDTVVDPYCGSGSTGEAAQNCGRRFLLGDIDRRMVELASRRLGFSTNCAETSPVGSPLPECPIMKVTPPEPHLWGRTPRRPSGHTCDRKAQRNEEFRWTLECLLRHPPGLAS
jgi:DNA methylase